MIIDISSAWLMGPAVEMNLPIGVIRPYNKKAQQDSNYITALNYI